MKRLVIVVLTCFLVSNRAVKVLFYGHKSHKRDADDGGLMMRAPFWDPGGSKALFAAVIVLIISPQKLLIIRGETSLLFSTVLVIYVKCVEKKGGGETHI